MLCDYFIFIKFCTKIHSFLKTRKVVSHLVLDKYLFFLQLKTEKQSILLIIYSLSNDDNVLFLRFLNKMRPRGEFFYSRL